MKLLFLIIITTVVSANNWEKINLDKDPFIGKEIIAFVNTSKDKGRFGDNIKLIIKCSKNNYPEILIDWNTFLGTKEVKMLERILSYDKEMEEKFTELFAKSEENLKKIGESYFTAYARSYTVSMDSKSLFYPANTELKSNYGHSLKVKLYNLVTNKTLLLKVAPYNDNYITASFELDGLKDIIEPYKETCQLINEQQNIELINKMISNTKKSIR